MIQCTQRESEVLRLLGDGLSNKVIALRLGISPHTVRDHVCCLMQRHRLSNRVALAVYANSRHWQIAGGGDFQPADCASPRQPSVTAWHSGRELSILP